MPDETPMPNSPEARTPTGEIKPATEPTTTPSTSSSPTPSTEPATLATQVQPETKPEAEPEPAKVPEKYELKAPEGQTLDSEALEKATPVFKELGLSNDQAQRLFDVHQDIIKAALDAPLKTYEKMRTDWRSEVVADRQIGDGREGLSAQARQDINAAFSAIGNDRLVAEFKQAMDLTGAGDNPAFLRAFAALGRNFREGTAVAGTSPSPLGQRAPNSGPRSAAAALYPNLPSSS